jgi:hypothetical protein
MKYLNLIKDFINYIWWILIAAGFTLPFWTVIFQAITVNSSKYKLIGITIVEFIAIIIIILYFSKIKDKYKIWN